MARVDRQRVKDNIRTEAPRLAEPLRGVVAMLAQAHEWPEPKLVDVAMMRLDVIADFCGRDDAALQTILAKRVFEQLVLPDPGPASRGVPLVPLRRLATNAHSTQPFHLVPCFGHFACSTPS